MKRGCSFELVFGVPVPAIGIPPIGARGPGFEPRLACMLHGVNTPERVTGIEPAGICLEGSVLTIEETPA